MTGTTEASAALRAALADRYRIERELGQGGMAVVYLAEDLKHRRQVAIKVLRPELAAVLGPERFLREIDTAARLNHPHILPIHDSGEAGGLLYYVMPYVEGESLRGKLAREKQLPLDEALQIAREVADGLSYAHEHNVVHRDIKPENILLESGHAVVADFGLARAITTAGVATLTQSGMMVGTPAYMSPEQASGSQEVDGRADLYALGCVLFEMLAGRPPFTGPTPDSLVYQHLSIVPRAVSELRPAVPGGVAAAVQRALAKAPADRFSTLTQFAEALGPGDLAPTVVVPRALPTRPPRRRWPFALLGAAAVIVVAGALVLLRPSRPAPTPAMPAHAHSAIAVLPFQNLSVEGPHAYFASGLHDELLTQLAKVASLKVISRTSVMGYQGTTKPLRQIADELGVRSVVEGTVQVVGGRLRVNVQLIDAATDEHLWAERYDRTLDDAFAIQSEVAQQIVAAVGAALTSDEQGRLTESPTANAEAYRLYLQGRESLNRPGYLRQNFEAAQHLFERALGLDPNFALAHAALSQVHGWMYWLRYDYSATRAARQREEAEVAVRIAPDLPQAHVAMGLAHYWGRREYRQALDEFLTALQGLPNDAVPWLFIGSVHRRLGNWDDVFAAFDKAVQLDPRSADTFAKLGGVTYELVRRYADAVRAYDRALDLAPDYEEVAILRGDVYARWHGELDTLRVVLSRIPSDAEFAGVGFLPAKRATLLLWERDADGLLRELQRAHVDVFEAQDYFTPAVLYAAWAHQLRGDGAAAQAAFASALALVDTAMKDLPDDSRMHAARGLALAGLGRRDDARREAQWLQRFEIDRQDAYDGPGIAEERARILAQAGDATAALDEIERLLAEPSWLSVHILQLDPRWDPVREHPRFQALLAK